MEPTHSRRGHVHRRNLLLLLTLAFPVVAGCSNRPTKVGSVLISEGGAKKHVHTAMTGLHADERRHAIQQLKVTRHARKDFVVDAALSVAKLDPSDSVRVAAVQLAVQSERADVARELISVVLREKGTLQASARVREEIVRGLTDMVLAGAIPAEDDEAVGSTVAQLARLDPSRNVRIAAARMLGHYPRKEAVQVLVAALSDRDFGVTYHAHESLVQLTGQDLGMRSDPWRRWLDETDDPFVNAADASADRANWWQRMVRSFDGEDKEPESASQ